MLHEYILLIFNTFDSQSERGTHYSNTQLNVTVNSDSTSQSIWNFSPTSEHNVLSWTWYIYNLPVLGLEQKLIPNLIIFWVGATSPRKDWVDVIFPRAKWCNFSPCTRSCWMLCDVHGCEFSLYVCRCGGEYSYVVTCIFNVWFSGVTFPRVKLCVVLLFV